MKKSKKFFVRTGRVRKSGYSTKLFVRIRRVRKPGYSTYEISINGDFFYADTYEHAICKLIYLLSLDEINYKEVKTINHEN